MAKKVESKEVKKGDDLTRDTEETHILPVKIDDAYRAKAANELADKVQELKNIDTEKKAAVAQFKARAERVAEEINELSQTVRSGTIQDSVPCILTLNFSTLMAVLRRKKGGELVRQRPMTPTEKNSDPTPDLKFPKEAEKKDGKA